MSPRGDVVTRLGAGRAVRAGRKAVKTKRKRLAFCAAHSAEHSKVDSKGGGWLDREPLCPDCEWNAGYDEGFADAALTMCARCPAARAGGKKLSNGQSIDLTNKQ